MKANEAPEKIWMDSEWISHFDCKDCITEDSIEYIRADAFIKKACSWLRTHSEVDYFELIPDANYCGAGNLNKKRMIEDFRKYMEGE